DNEEKLYTKAIMRAYARRSALLEPTAIHPPGLILNDDTLQEGPQIQEGELTDGVYSFAFLPADKFLTTFYS
ncbi:hypothetical protein WUBG_00566, partial [Wuchereria bancrofti]